MPALCIVDCPRDEKSQCGACRVALDMTSRRASCKKVIFILSVSLVTWVCADERDVKIYWWENPPYFFAATNDSSNANWDNNLTTGVYRMVVEDLLTYCRDAESDKFNVMLEQQQESRDYYKQLGNKSGSFENSTLVFIAVNAPQNINFFHKPLLLLEAEKLFPGRASFIPILDLPGAVHIYKRDDEQVGSDLVTVIIQGWPLLILILLGAGYSGIIIWLLDRLWNPTNFPKPFVRGFWEGFWWAFVTMTTVGYGDTTPRSIQARVYGLIWIVVGITILSVFTATVTTVLTQESMGAQHPIQGAQIGVLQDSEEFKLVVKGGGTPIEYENFGALMDVLKSQDNALHGALIDQYSFASLQKQLKFNNILIEKLVPNPVEQGLVVISPHTRISECMEEKATFLKDRAFRLLSRLILPLTRSSAEEGSQSLFLPQTITYLWYGLGAWTIIFISFIIWEFGYWRPKHRKRKAAKQKCALEAYVLGQTDQEQIRRQKKDVYIPRVSLARQKQLNGDIKMKEKFQFHANKGFSMDEFHLPLNKRTVTFAESDNTAKLPTSSSGLNRTEVDSLEKLVRLQKEELNQLDEEMTNFREEWTRRQTDLRRFHREQRRELIRFLGSTLESSDSSTKNQTESNATDEQAIAQHI